MTKQLSLLEQICYSTTRIECEKPNGDKGTGTGFFFSLKIDDEKSIPMVVTNRHVAEGMAKGRFKLTKSDKDGNPNLTDHFTLDFSKDFDKMWTYHPDPNIDLCAMPIGQLVSAAKQMNANLFYRTFDNNIIPNKQQQEELDVVEDILMIGYPNGIWDSHNNMPIIRKGTTATHPNIDYNGKKEFMIDAACFPGSSGSPVLLYNNSGYSTKNGGFNIGAARLYFLGILYSGPQHTATGELQVVNVPNLQVPMTFSRIPNNLGIVIKSEKVLDFLPIFKQKFNL
ncbi:serine protease [Gaetbulibacter sp. M235]|uniref:S1 family peptidase n=1 Tax=Gaetbulibacter sp. M235 TaxID=3126510 RepID=UPI00374EF69F